MASYGPESLRIDADTEADRISDAIRAYVRTSRRKGAVVAVSGGIDSSVGVALCVRALGADRVLALQLPEAESAEATLELSSELIASLGVPSVCEDISGIREAYGCYRRRDDEIRSLVPDCGPGYRVDQEPPAQDGHVLNVPVTGGVLLQPPVRPDGPVPPRRQQRSPG
ncbi:MAG: adenine nucleotide alpha hydrolase family protein [Propionibacteriaceae bacterium]